MGKLANFIVFLVFIDLLLLMTGQLAVDSSISMIVGAILDPSLIKTSQFWLQLGLTSGLTAGLAALGVGVAVFIGTAITKAEVILFIPLAFTLALLVGDFITIFTAARSLNPILASIIITPIIILFSFTILEWLRGKD